VPGQQFDCDGKNKLKDYEGGATGCAWAALECAGSDGALDRPAEIESSSHAAAKEEESSPLLSLAASVTPVTTKEENTPGPGDELFSIAAEVADKSKAPSEPAHSKTLRSLIL
jgi:hypothetical protein